MPVGNPVTDLSGPGNYVPVTRTLTINGVTYDLSANRTWTVGVGSVSSVGLVMPTGFSVSNSPVTSSGDLTVAFAAGYSLPTTAKQTQWDSAYSFTSTFPVGTAFQLLRYNTLGTALEFFTPSYLTPVDIIATTPLVWNSGTNTMSIPMANNTTDGYLSSADWLTFSSKQPAITLTTTGDSGPSTFNVITGALNIPEYTLLGLGGFYNPMTTTGDIIVARSTGEAFRFGGNTSTTRKYFSQIGDGTVVTSSSWQEINATTLGVVPTSRQLTINGTAYDLSADRSWSVGTVTSIGVSMPTGFSVASSPITSSGTIAITFASGYSLPTTASQSEWDSAYTNRITSLTTTGNSGTATLIANTLNIPEYTLAGLGGMSNPMTGANGVGDIIYGNAIGAPLRRAPNVTTNKMFLSSTGDGTSGNAPVWEQILPSTIGAVPTSRQITINGTAYDLTADRSWSVGTVTSVGLSTSTTGVTIGSTPVTSSGTITINIDTASSILTGLLSSTDWTTFNDKMNNPMTSLGDMIYGNAVGFPIRRAGNITTTKMFLSQTGNGTTSAAPQWSTVTASDVGAVPTTRTLTINDVPFDLSADRSWSVGDFGTW